MVLCTAMPVTVVSYVFNPYQGIYIGQVEQKGRQLCRCGADAHNTAEVGPRSKLCSAVCHIGCTMGSHTPVYLAAGEIL